jgi:predicted transposase/invertase (TIGR01784 family)
MTDKPPDTHDKQGNLHNNFFLSCFSKPLAMKRLLAELAPKPLFDLIGPEPPVLVPGSFVDEKLRGRQTDLLFRARLKKGGDAFLYVLVDHKSVPQRSVLLQLLRYKCNIWSTLCEEEGPLTPIIPVVFYHGVRRWNVGPTFHDAFDNLDDRLRLLTDQFHYLLIDIGRIDDERLPAHPELRTQLVALKHAVRQDILEVGLPLLASLLAGLPDVEVSRVLRYILTQHPEIGREDLDRVLLEHAPKLKDSVMNGFLQDIFSEGETKGMADGLAKGKAEGKAEGLAEGLAKGEAKGKAETLLALLLHRFGGVPRAVERRIRAADCKSLERWTLRIFEGDTPRDVIAD